MDICHHNLTRSNCGICSALKTNRAEPVSADELDALRLDAARYRFWRELWCRDDDMEAMNNLAPDGFDGEDEWDAILDGARKVQA